MSFNEDRHDAHKHTPPCPFQSALMLSIVLWVCLCATECLRFAKSYEKVSLFFWQFPDFVFKQAGVTSHFWPVDGSLHELEIRASLTMVTFADFILFFLPGETLGFNDDTKRPDGMEGRRDHSRVFLLSITVQHTLETGMKDSNNKPNKKEQSHFSKHYFGDPSQSEHYPSNCRWLFLLMKCKSVHKVIV